MEDEPRQTVHYRNWFGALSSWLVATVKSSSASIRSSIIKPHDDPKPELAPLPLPPPLPSPTAPPISDSMPMVISTKINPSFSPSSTDTQAKSDLSPISHHPFKVNLQGECDSDYSSSTSSPNLRARPGALPFQPPIMSAAQTGWNNDHPIPIDSPSPSSSSSSSPSPSSVDSRRASLPWMHGGAHTTTDQWMKPITRTSCSMRRSLTMSGSELPYYHVWDTPPHVDHDQSQTLHPIIELFRKQELGRHILVLTVPLTTGLLAIYNPSSDSLLARLTALSLSIGFAATWNGILLRGMFPRGANAIEQLGVAFIFLAFFALVGSFLPETLVWAPALCCGLSLLPFAFAFFFNRKRAPQNDDVHPVPCV